MPEIDIKAMKLTVFEDYFGKLKKIPPDRRIYTDGSFSYHTKKGGWACIILNFIRDKVEFVKLWESCKEDCTNNRMELQAILESLKYLKKPSEIVLYSDSKYALNSIGFWLRGEPRLDKKGWVINWQENGWLTAEKKPVQNIDIFLEILERLKFHKSFRSQWVRGHANDKLNIFVDNLAVSARKKVEEV